MTRWEYTYLWWEGSATTTSNGLLGPTTPPMSEEVIDKLNTLGADGWEIDHITAAPTHDRMDQPPRWQRRRRVHRQSALPRSPSTGTTTRSELGEARFRSAPLSTTTSKRTPIGTLTTHNR